ncbi:CbtB-domain containing protein [Blastococcus sp. TML/M2B]|uniref:CbtB-domain containing protein n=1 Tax=unclassified Blastococcus TaxID=2619396 RepID=UPI00190AB206|nr:MULTISPECIES: CbtB-domain containing protein [unclassified Blastococcus]MBN1093215.1 CbtB-domain containing protein [Blastococcus sp. TML/M2B]MBN1096674.1 CbtB-domain containing protein [Blastococcus sp. TML/C7B]
MTSVPHAHPATAASRIAVPAWAWALALLGLFGLYLIAQDNGAVLASMGGTAHEFFHDARHSLGMPCH